MLPQEADGVHDVVCSFCEIGHDKLSKWKRHHCGNGGARLGARTARPQVLHRFSTCSTWPGLRWPRTRDFMALVDRSRRQRDFIAQMLAMGQRFSLRRTELCAACPFARSKRGRKSRPAAFEMTVWGGAGYWGRRRRLQEFILPRDVPRGYLAAWRARGAAKPSRRVRCLASILAR